MENEEKIYLDEEGYKKYLQDIEDLKNQINNNGKQKSSAYVSAVGDGWHDNFEFEDAKREELRLLGLLKEKVAGLSRIVVVNNKKTDDSIVVGDYVTVNLYFNNADKPMEKIFRLVGVSNPDISGDIMEISINSPLGKAVYMKKTGDKFDYVVGSNTVSGLITNKEKSLSNKAGEDSKLKRGK